ncbi:GNAT family N-acetyltransferase [Streptomyces sp. WAC 06783]|uniref:GNAT family N-acetyltransferase n=1 Tax=Streptomyces sp. WAC 06783 TaxID=2203211 RepID=UPI000F740EFB|nr:GNAT family N-acetyltransferase [Streptomyces sp. WAC 06783]RSO13427.1 GNAT family N-acetyltransferase [Streptomyces sp. WAC 06783]
MDIEVRTVGDDDIPEWIRALEVGFLRPPSASEEQIEYRRARYDPARTQGAYDDGRCVATFRSFAQELTVVGGTPVPADAITSVTVSPTHRRRGLLSRMMANDLRLAKERGDALATLIAAEFPIYGRYGFGPATWTTEWHIDVARAGLDPRHAGPDCGGRIDFADAAGILEAGPALHDRFRARQPGAIDLSHGWWRELTGAVQRPHNPAKDRFHALYRNASGEVEGLVSYRADDTWERKLPQNTVTVDRLTALTPAAERALWRFLCSIDWVMHIKSGYRGPDDLLPYHLGDPRAARIEQHADYLWIRPLDVPRLLEARTYPAEGSLVLGIRDKAGLADGRYLLEATPQGATCTRTDRPAELTLDVADFAALYLGDESAVRLHALGRVTEERPGALATSDLLLHTARRPWCPDIF